MAQYYMYLPRSVRRFSERMRPFLSISSLTGLQTFLYIQFRHQTARAPVPAYR